MTDHRTEDAHWEPHRIYFAGDTVTDEQPYLGSDDVVPPTPAGRFRALLDHYSGLLGPRYLEVDSPGVWERVETL
jgi:hypothetical protein